MRGDPDPSRTGLDAHTETGLVVGLPEQGPAYEGGMGVAVVERLAESGEEDVLALGRQIRPTMTTELTPPAGGGPAAMQLAAGSGVVAAAAAFCRYSSWTGWSGC